MKYKDIKDMFNTIPPYFKYGLSELCRVCNIVKDDDELTKELCETHFNKLKQKLYVEVVNEDTDYTYFQFCNKGVVISGHVIGGLKNSTKIKSEFKLIQEVVPFCTKLSTPNIEYNIVDYILFYSAITTKLTPDKIFYKIKYNRDIIKYIVIPDYQDIDSYHNYYENVIKNITIGDFLKGKGKIKINNREYKCPKYYFQNINSYISDSYKYDKNDIKINIKKDIHNLNVLINVYVLSKHNLEQYNNLNCKYYIYDDDSGINIIDFNFNNILSLIGNTIESKNVNFKYLLEDFVCDEKYKIKLVETIIKYLKNETSYNMNTILNIPTLKIKDNNILIKNYIKMKIDNNKELQKILDFFKPVIKNTKGALWKYVGDKYEKDKDMYYNNIIGKLYKKIKICKDCNGILITLIEFLNNYKLTIMFNNSDIINWNDVDIKQVRELVQILLYTKSKNNDVTQDNDDITYHLDESNY